jgi:hypothetical protein
VPKSELREQLGKAFKVKDDKTIQLYGFRTNFGGGRSTGFALIYDSLEDLLDTEPKHRLVRVRARFLASRGVWLRGSAVVLHGPGEKSLLARVCMGASPRECRLSATGGVGSSMGSGSLLAGFAVTGAAHDAPAHLCASTPPPPPPPPPPPLPLLSILAESLKRDAGPLVEMSLHAFLSFLWGCASTSAPH